MLIPKRLIPMLGTYTSANSIFSKEINQYNSLPENVRNEVKISTFKIQLKKYSISVLNKK